MQRVIKGVTLTVDSLPGPAFILQAPEQYLNGTPSSQALDFAGIYLDTHSIRPHSMALPKGSCHHSQSNLDIGLP